VLLFDRQEKVVSTKMSVFFVLAVDTIIFVAKEIRLHSSTNTGMFYMQSIVHKIKLPAIPTMIIQDGPDHFNWEPHCEGFVNRKVYTFSRNTDAEQTPNFEELIGTFLGHTMFNRFSKNFPEVCFLI
jgi:hypothetical protein